MGKNDTPIHTKSGISAVITILSTMVRIQKQARHRLEV